MFAAAQQPQQPQPDLNEATISDIEGLITTQAATCTELTSHFLDRIASLDGQGPSLHAVISTAKAAALQQAARLDRWFAATGTLNGSLHCVPVLVKDNTDVAGSATTCGVNALLASTPRTSAWVVDRLVNQGAVVVAKTNLPPFASTGVRTESETGGLCVNPYNRSASCFGSSGGTGAGIAAGYAVIGIGTDTCGSILFPSGGGDLVGLRSTWGRLPLDGVFPGSPFADVVGPMARTALDAAKAMDAITRTTAFTAAIDQPLAGLRIGLVELFLQPFNATVQTPMGPVWVRSDPPAVTVSAVRTAAATLVRLAGCQAGSLNLSLDALTPLMNVAMLGGCANDCSYSLTDAYFKDTERFPLWDAGAAYHSMDDLIDANRLPPDWQRSFKEQRDSTNATSCARCQDTFWPAQTALQSALESDQWLAGYDVLLYPTWLDAVPLANASDPQPPPAPMYSCVLSSYSGYPSIGFNVGWWQQQQPNGGGGGGGGGDQFPVGATALARRGREDLLLRLAYGFDAVTNHQFRRSPPGL